MSIRHVRNEADRHFLFGYALVGVATSLVELATAGRYVTDWRRHYLCLDEEEITSYWEASRIAALTIMSEGD